MNRFTFWSAACVLAVITLTYAGGEDVWTFRGEIADSQCALNVHSLTRSHQEMLKSKSMGGTSTSCSLYCIKNLGGEFVLAAGKTVYRLDKQDAVRDFAGQKAKITGTLDPKTKTIHVEKVEIEAQQ